jgi:hypothetical protein
MDIFNGHLVLFVNKKSFPALCSVNLPIKFNSVVHKFLLLSNSDLPGSSQMEFFLGFYLLCIYCVIIHISFFLHY